MLWTLFKFQMIATWRSTFHIVYATHHALCHAIRMMTNSAGITAVPRIYASINKPFAYRLF